LSQAGMVVHWRKTGGPGARQSMFINGLGAVATAITVIVVLIAKFSQGAWIVVVLIPAIILTMHSVKRHYDRVEQETKVQGPIKATELKEPIILIPVEHWSVVSEKAVRFAWRLSHDIRIVHIECGEQTDILCRDYAGYVEGPAKAAGLPVPELVILKSPYRFIIRPIVGYTQETEKANPDKTIAVLIPELVESRWYYFLLHNNRSQALKALLLFSGGERTTVINIPWYLDHPKKD
jgi:hypothetical protein